MIKLNLQAIIEKAQGVTSKGLAIMKERETGDIESIIDEIVKVDNYEFGTSTEGEYVAFTIVGNDTEFFFGGSVVTDNFKKLDNLLSDDERHMLLENGLEMKLEKKRSENKRTYTMCIFFPNN